MRQLLKSYIEVIRIEIQEPVEQMSIQIRDLKKRKKNRLIVALFLYKTLHHLGKKERILCSI